MKIGVQNLTKIYCKGTSNEVKAINNLSLKIKEGDFCIITGQSGSGKTTLLSLLGLLTRPTRGKIFYEDQEVSLYSDSWQTRIRKEKVGFIFQHYNLLPQFPAWENVALPNLCRQITKADRRKKAIDIMDKLGLGHRINFKVAHLSGGEQQRIAIARALITNPEIIFADEPTASVDNDTAIAIIELFQSLKEEGKTVIISTHDGSLLNKGTIHINLQKGELMS